MHFMTEYMGMRPSNFKTCIQREATHIRFMNALRTQLLETAAAYCAVKSISMSTLSHKIVNDGKVLDRIAAGRDIHTATFEKFMEWFRNNWPRGVQCPPCLTSPLLF